MEIQNIEMKYTNMNMQVNNAPFQMQNMGMNIFNNNNLEQNYNKDFNIKKMNILFKNAYGQTKNLIFNYGTTINEVLERFLKEIGRPELINNIDNKLDFICETNIVEKL